MFDRWQRLCSAPRADVDCEEVSPSHVWQHPKDVLLILAQPGEPLPYPERVDRLQRTRLCRISGWEQEEFREPETSQNGLRPSPGCNDRENCLGHHEELERRQLPGNLQNQIFCRRHERVAQALRRQKVEDHLRLLRRLHLRQRLSRILLRVSAGRSRWTGICLASSGYNDELKTKSLEKTFTCMLLKLNS